MQKRASQILVGELLVNSEMVSLPQLADAMPVALKSGIPVGRVLIAAGFLSEAKFKQALSLQSLVRDQLISETDAVAALKMIARESLELNEAFKKLGIESEFFEGANKLGEILISAGVINTSTLEEALAASYTTGLQLARVLALRGLVQEQTAFVALIAQSLLRDHKLTRDQAIASIKAVISAPENKSKLVSHHTGLLISSSMTARKANPMRLGELLLLSGMVAQADLLSALDQGISEEVPLGRILVRMNLLTGVELNQALTLHEMISNSTIAAQDAVYVLASVKASKVSLSKALSQSEQHKNENALISFAEFLQICGLVSQADIELARKECNNTDKSLDDLVDEKTLFEHSYATFSRQCYENFRSKRLNDEQCAFLLQLRLVNQKKEDLNEALKFFNW